MSNNQGDQQNEDDQTSLAIYMQRAPPKDVTRIRLPSSTNSEDGGYLESAHEESTQSSRSRPLYVGHNRLWQGSRQSQQMGLAEQDFQTAEAAQKKIITPKKMLEKYILKDETVLSYPCSAIVCGMQGCGKTTAVEQLLMDAVKLKDEHQNITPLLEFPVSQVNKKCLSCYKAIIVGARPFNNLTWLVSNGESDNAAICLISYFANMCKIQHKDSDGKKYYNLLQFMPLQDVKETLEPATYPAEVAVCINELYEALIELWERLATDVNIQAALPTGVSLVNLFDVGPSQAARDFLPFLNQYCNRAIHFACYDKEEDYESLTNGAGQTSDNDEYQSKKYQLLRQLCEIKEKKPLILAATKGTAPPTANADKLTPVVVKANCFKNSESIKHISANKDEISQSRPLLERTAMDPNFRTNMPLQYAMLLYVIKSKNSQSFLVRRSEIESISKVFKFTDEDLEKCLLFFSSFGSIFYTHNVPSLKKYVIIDVVRFIEYIHSLYESQEETAKFGLFKHSDDEEQKIVFEILVTFGIAAEVRSNQITQICQDTLTTYYYIPTARKTCTTDSVPAEVNNPVAVSRFMCLISLMGHTKENLQVCLCKLLLNENCFLIPTEDINTTGMRFYELGEADVIFIDTGNTVYIKSMRNDISLDTKKRDEIYKKVTHNETFFMTQMSKVKVINRMLSAQVLDKKPEVELKKVILIAKQLSLYSNSVTRLTEILDSVDEQREKTTELLGKELSETEKLTCLVYKLYHQKCASYEDFKKTVEDLGASIPL